MPDLPVAAPDHAAAIKLALESPTPYFDDEYAMFKDRRDAALAALDVLLAERRQDKERIERLETPLGELVSVSYDVIYKANGLLRYVEDRGKAAVQAYDESRERFAGVVNAAQRVVRSAAALAVEEDATP